jgi:hypothetical protein
MADRVELNSRVFALTHELAGSLAARNVIRVCLDCDPGGHESHLDPDHSITELIEAGAKPWSRPTRPAKTALVRVPMFPSQHGGRT